MATFTWYAYYGTPAWTDIGSNTLVFCGDGSDIDIPIEVAAWQDGTHIGTGDPGTDVCTTNHCNNVKYLTSGTMSVNGGGSEDINDTNLAETECTLKINFSHGTAVVITNARLYVFDGTTVTTEGVGIEVQAFERGVSATAWTEINDDSDSFGGDNSGERLALSGKSSGTSHDWFVALSASAESVGDKTSFDIGFALTYS